MQKRIVPVVLGVIKKDDTYLLTQRAQLDPEDKPFFLTKKPWQLPGGGVEFGETPEEALIREMLEELSVEIKEVKLINNICIETRGNWQGLFLPYLCYPARDDFSIVLNEESSDYGWFSLNEIREMYLFPKILEIIETVASLKKST